jgi:hypothetical protein
MDTAGPNDRDAISAPGCASESVHAGMDAFENVREHAESGHDASTWPRRVCM